MLLDEFFEFELQLITSPNVRQVVRDVLRYKADPRMPILTASSSKKYHPLNKKGEPETLVEHTKSVFRLLKILLSHPMIGGKFTTYDKDIMLGASLLHDCVKYGLPDQTSETTVHRHPILVACLYPYDSNNKTTQEYKIFSDLVFVVMAHHGPWNRSDHDTVTLPEITDNRQYYLHMADYIASRRIIQIDTDDTDEVRGLLS